MNKEEAEALLGFQITDGWTFHEIKRCGELAGFVMQKGPEIHCYRRPEFEGRWGTKHTITNIVQPVIDQYGYTTTMVRKDNLQGHRFVQRLGFHATGETEKTVTYKAERLNHARF